MRLRLPIFVLFGLAAASGCTRDVIPNTDVEDTADNREVLEFCERYRAAVEERNVPSLMSLVSDRYYDDNGTPSGLDDVDFDGLAEKLNIWREGVLDIRYEIRYRRVTFNRDRVLVDYTYTGSFRVHSALGERWARRLADNRLTLEREGEGEEFRIVSGM
jgi:hypothetical protein